MTREIRNSATDPFIYPEIQFKEQVITIPTKVTESWFLGLFEKTFEKNVVRHIKMEARTSLRVEVGGRYYIQDFMQSIVVQPSDDVVIFRHRLYKNLIKEVYMFLCLGILNPAAINGRGGMLNPEDKSRIPEHERLQNRYIYNRYGHYEEDNFEKLLP